MKSITFTDEEFEEYLRYREMAKTYNNKADYVLDWAIRKQKAKEAEGKQ